MDVKLLAGGRHGLWFPLTLWHLECARIQRELVGTDTAPKIYGRFGLRPPGRTLVSVADPLHTVSTYETTPFDSQPRPSHRDFAFTCITALQGSVPLIKATVT